MSNFYLSDPKVLTELKLQDDDFRIYSYCCKQFNVKNLTSFIRLVDIAGQFQLSLEQVQHSLVRMTRIRIDSEPLIKIKDAGKYLVFDLPRHRTFIKDLGFKRYNSSKGWKLLKDHISNKATNKTYLYSKLDQYELEEQLVKLPTAEFKKINKTDLKYPWSYENAKKLRASN